MYRYALAWFVAITLCAVGIAARAQPAEPAKAASPATSVASPRIALVIGNGGYGQGALPGALNDAGLVAEALRSIGFDVMEGADLKQAGLLTEFKNFAARVEAGGPNTIAAFYFSGYGFSLEKDNLLVAADAVLEGDTDIPLDTVRLAELLQPLSALPARAKIVMIDASRALPFPMKGVKVAPGLQAIDAPANTLVAFSASPGTLVADSKGPYSAYALAVAEMVREGGHDITDIFTRIRARTHQMTQGNQTPWDVSALAAGVKLTTSSPAPQTALRAVRPMSGIGVEEAYALAIEQDTLAGYAEFVRVFPASTYTPHILAMLHARRDALTWQQALETDSAAAYWTYLRRYPEGIYVADAERRLARLSSALQPPAQFEQVKFAGVPLPVRGEPARRVESHSHAPPPARLIAPRPALYANLAPSSREGLQRGSRTGANVLPVPTLPRGSATLPAITTPPAHPAPRRPRHVKPRAPPVQQAPVQPGGFFAPANPAPAPPRSLAPPLLRPAQPRPAPRQPQCTVENGQTVCR